MRMMTMTPNLQRILRAYRPLYLHGLLLDGQYRLPRQPPSDPVPARPSPRWLTLGGLLQALLHVRSES